MDVFDPESWPLLSEMRMELRDKIFDEKNPDKEEVFQKQLEEVDWMIKQGYLRYVPF